MNPISLPSTVKRIDLTVMLSEYGDETFSASGVFFKFQELYGDTHQVYTTYISTNLVRLGKYSIVLKKGRFWKFNTKLLPLVELMKKQKEALLASDYALAERFKCKVKDQYDEIMGY